RGAKIDAIYSSDLQRARETAQIIARPHSLPVEVDQRLREIALGEWEGLRVIEVMVQYPREYSERQQSPLHSRAPGGESVAEVAARMREAADEIACARPGERVVIVSHGLALATLLCRVRGVGLERARDLIPDNARTEETEWMPDSYSNSV
ncbi:MAG: histidine phosphatase family protein, partial [Chloroflexi bacterium]|nr:histidine phosphatase family protein [Chloroflexota bacterium]